MALSRLAVVGHPVAHSRSPAMHSAAFAALGLDREWTYEAIDLPPERFAAGIAELRERGFAGVNVTVPHKRAAYELAGQRSVAVESIGAANTLSFSTAGIRADNTDASGLLAALPPRFEPAGAAALVLGAGGSARAVAWALAGAGARVTIANRTEARARGLASELGVASEPMPDEGATFDLAPFELLVNATSVGLASPGAQPPVPGADLKALRLDADQLISPLVVVDLVYGSGPTELAATCTSGGATLIDGLEVLVRQGGDSFRIWVGQEPPIDVMRNAIRDSR
ncbi:MAG TPA: shikimate dehydrogenase [Solirubrobacterales bacterium]|nr:shikimate dehydrogenase [Solirubrobacterales bacterium]